MRVGDMDGKLAIDVARQTKKLDKTERAAQPERPAEEGPSPFARILQGLGREVDHGEAVVRRAVSGAHAELGSGDLLALQAGVYRYSEAVDLSAKLVDRASSGVKTVLQGQ